MKGLKIIVLSLPFVMIGIWAITQEPFGTINYIFGWISTCFFGLGIPVGLFHTFDRKPQIIISESGVWDRTTNQDEIKWEQIIEAYPLDIFEQKFISLVTDDTYIFKKKQYKWASKINKKIGAQQFNLQLGQINIDVNQLTDLINRLSKSQKEDRKKILQSFKPNSKSFSISNFQKILLYVIISITLLLLSLTGITAFMTISIIMGIATLISRFYSGSNNNPSLRKYARIITYFGFVNIGLLLITLKTYDYTAESIGYKISNGIENYFDRFNSYPENIGQINESLDFNFAEKYFSNRIEYKVKNNEYSLKLKTLFNKKKKYDKEMNEWK